MTQAEPDEVPAVGELYRSSRLRLDGLLRPLDAPRWTTPVPACPGWTVRDVLAHLVGIHEDASAGRIRGVPGPDQTAAQVDRHREDDPLELLDQWARTAPGFERAISEGSRWPAYLDLLSHELDVRGALVEPALVGQLAVEVDLAGRLLAGGVVPAIEIDLDGSSGGEIGRGGERAALRLRTTPFEVLRLRMGRRSRSQVLSLDWSDDPAAVVDQLFIFGPAETPLRF